MRPAAHASCEQHVFGMTTPGRPDGRRVTPKACLRHDAFEGHEGETFLRLAGRPDRAMRGLARPGDTLPRAEP